MWQKYKQINANHNLPTDNLKWCVRNNKNSCSRSEESL